MWKDILVFSTILVTNFFELTSCTSSCERELAKVFRTPKDYAKVNFDHFELLERNNFEVVEPTTTPVIPTSTSKGTEERQESKPVFANAQVMLRFGGDDIQGENHVMKIPDNSNLMRMKSRNHQNYGSARHPHSGHYYSLSEGRYVQEQPATYPHNAARYIPPIEGSYTVPLGNDNPLLVGNYNLAKIQPSMFYPPPFYHELQPALVPKVHECQRYYHPYPPPPPFTFPSYYYLTQNGAYGGIPPHLPKELEKIVKKYYLDKERQNGGKTSTGYETNFEYSSKGSQESAENQKDPSEIQKPLYNTNFLSVSDPKKAAKKSSKFAKDLIKAAILNKVLKGIKDLLTTESKTNQTTANSADVKDNLNSASTQDTSNISYSENGSFESTESLVKEDKSLDISSILKREDSKKLLEMAIEKLKSEIFSKDSKIISGEIKITEKKEIIDEIISELKHKSALNKEENKHLHNSKSKNTDSQSGESVFIEKIEISKEISLDSDLGSADRDFISSELNSNSKGISSSEEGKSREIFSEVISEEIKIKNMTEIIDNSSEETITSISKEILNFKKGTSKEIIFKEVTEISDEKNKEISIKSSSTSLSSSEIVPEELKTSGITKVSDSIKKDTLETNSQQILDNDEIEDVNVTKSDKKIEYLYISKETLKNAALIAENQRFDQFEIEDKISYESSKQELNNHNPTETQNGKSILEKDDESQSFEKSSNIDEIINEQNSESADTSEKSQDIFKGISKQHSKNKENSFLVKSSDESLQSSSELREQTVENTQDSKVQDTVESESLVETKITNVQEGESDTKYLESSYSGQSSEGTYKDFKIQSNKDMQNSEEENYSNSQENGDTSKKNNSKTNSHKSEQSTYMFEDKDELLEFIETDSGTSLHKIIKSDDLVKIIETSEETEDLLESTENYSRTSSYKIILSNESIETSETTDDSIEDIEKLEKSVESSNKGKTKSTHNKSESIEDCVCPAKEINIDSLVAYIYNSSIGCLQPIVVKCPLIQGICRYNHKTENRMGLEDHEGTNHQHQKRKAVSEFYYPISRSICGSDNKIENRMGSEDLKKTKHQHFEYTKRQKREAIPEFHLRLGDTFVNNQDDLLLKVPCATRFLFSEDFYPEQDIIPCKNTIICGGLNENICTQCGLAEAPKNYYVPTHSCQPICESPFKDGNFKVVPSYIIPKDSLKLVNIVLPIS